MLRKTREPRTRKMSDNQQDLDFDTLVSSGSSLAYIWNNVNKKESVKRDHRYKKRGGRLTGPTADLLKHQVKLAIEKEEIILVTAGGNDIFDQKTRKIRWKEETRDNTGKKVEWDIVKELQDFMKEIIWLTHKHQRVLYVLSLFPRYYDWDTETQKYELNDSKSLKGINRKLQKTFENTARYIFKMEGVWVKARFLHLTPMFLDKPTHFFKDPVNDPHLSVQGKKTLVETIKQIMRKTQRGNFTLRKLKDTWDSEQRTTRHTVDGGGEEQESVTWGQPVQ